MSELANDRSLSDLELALAEPVPAPVANAYPLLVPNLLNDLDGLAGLLELELLHESWLNAFLLAAGMNQIAEDHLHEHAISLRRVARHVRRIGPRFVGSVAAAAIRTADAVAWAARDLSATEREAIAWQREMAALVNRLADVVAVGPSPVTRHGLVESSAAVLRRMDRLAAGLRLEVRRDENLQTIEIELAEQPAKPVPPKP